jgi:hypothetical protein
MVRRRVLLAYLVAAGVAGTLLVVPYAGRVAALEAFAPGRPIPLVPFILLPVVWGLWNALWAARQPPVSIGAWGAGLGLVAAGSMNLYLWAARTWFAAALFLLPFLPVLYYLLWRLVVGPLNEALGVEGERRQA